MTIFIEIEEDYLAVRRPSPPDVRADYRQRVRPGGIWQGYSYRELLAMGNGRHEVVDRDPPARP